MAQIRLAKQVARVGSERILELDPEQEQRALRLHRDSLVFDLHMQGCVLPEDIEADFDAWAGSYRYELGYEGIKKAGLHAFFEGMGFSVWANNGTQPLESVVREIGLRWCDMDRHPMVIRGFRVQDALCAKEVGKVAVFMTLETAEPIGADVDNIDLLYGLGVRSMGLAEGTLGLALGTSCGGPRTTGSDPGLTSFGERVIERMNEIGMLIDATHGGIRTTLDMIEASSSPIVVSHAGAYGVHPTIRMSTDEEIVALAEKGGVIGIHSGPNILSNATSQTVDVVVDHVEYCVKLVGVEHVAIGSDNFFGDKTAYHRKAISFAPDAAEEEIYVSFAAPYVDGFESPSEWLNVTRALVKRGFRDEEIEKLIGGNVLRILGEVIG